MVSAAAATPPEVFWYLHLTPAQKEALRELTAALNSELVPGLDDANTLLRFLKARAWCPAKAAKMYRVSDGRARGVAWAHVWGKGCLCVGARRAAAAVRGD